MASSSVSSSSSGARGPWREFGVNVVAGGAAGVVEVLCMYPLDVVKTRLQLQTATGAAAEYTSMGSVFRQIIQKEGFGNLYRGIVSPIMAEAPKRAVKFATNEQYKKMLAAPNGKLSDPRLFGAGALAGMTEALVNCPFEVVKVRMQAKENLNLYRSTSHAFMSVLKEEGPLALYKGLEPQLFRNGTWNGTYFALGAIVKRQMGERSSNEGRMTRDFVSGFCAGTVATCLSTPFDVVKSRMQNVGAGQSSKYRNALSGLKTVFVEEGPRAVYKGLAPRILRLGPGGGIMLVAFDVFKRWME